MKIGNLEVYGVIYKITNLVNKKVYIGQTITGFDKRYLCSGNNVERVYNWHYNKRKHNKPYNVHLLGALEKYGVKSFDVTKILDVAFSKWELDIKEKTYIEIYNSTSDKFGYNNREGGSNGRITEKTKLKMSISKKELYKRIKHPSIGGKASETTKIKMSIKRKGKNNPMYNVHRYGESNPMYGKHHSCETKKKIGKANSGKNNYWYGKKLPCKPNNNGVNNPNATKVLCVTTGKEFNTMKEAKEFYNIKGNHIGECCLGKIKSCGIHPITGEKLRWKYV